jgi:hypothetical protein
MNKLTVYSKHVARFQEISPEISTRLKDNTLLLVDQHGNLEIHFHIFYDWYRLQPPYVQDHFQIKLFGNLLSNEKALETLQSYSSVGRALVL